MFSFGYVACDRRRFERLFFQTNIRIDAAINDLRRLVFRKASTVPHFMSMEQFLPCSLPQQEKNVRFQLEQFIAAETVPSLVSKS